MVEIRLLGRFVVRSAGEEIPPAAFGGRLPRVLVRVLAARRGEFVPRDVLAEALWPGRLPRDPGANLTVLVNRARRALGDPGLLLTGPGGYALRGGSACAVDSERFLAEVGVGRDHLAAGQAGAALRTFTDALLLWGEPLPEDAYADWAQPYRTVLVRAHLDALEDGSVAALAVRDPLRAVGLAELAVGREPLREASALLLARALAAAGDSAGALSCLDGFRRRLRDEVGLDPGPDLATLQSRILAGVAFGPARAPTGRPEPAVFEDLSFVGRDEESTVLRQALAGSQPAVVLVAGVAGAGKSRLLAEAVRSLGVATLSTRAFPAERDEAWSLTRTVLREAVAYDIDIVRALPGRVAAALAEILPDVREFGLTIEDLPLDGESRRALVREGALRVLGAASTRGVVLVVDDLQWADASSLQVLTAVLARVPALRAAFAYRPDDLAAHEPAAAFLESLRGRDIGVHFVPLAPLTRGAVASLVADDELADAIATGTDRTPLAVGEVIRALARRGLVEQDPQGRWSGRDTSAPAAALDAGRAGHRHAIVARLARQPKLATEVMRLLALVGRESGARVLALAAGENQPAVLTALDALARAGLVRLGESGWAPAHDLVGRSVADALEPGQRAQLHLTLAQALAEVDADSAEVARHLAGAGDPAGAAAAYAEAARLRLDRHAAAEATAIAGQGLDLAPGPTLRGRLLRIRAEGRSITGDRRAAREDLRECLPLLTSAADRSTALGRMAMLTMAEDLAAASDLAETALTAAAGCPAARAEALTVAAFVDTTSGRLTRSDVRSAEALALFEEIGDGRGVARVLDARAGQLMLSGRLFEGEGLMGRAARLYFDSGSLALAGTVWCQRSWALGWMARPEDALADAETALELERTLGQAEGEAMALLMSGRALADLGEAGEGRRRIEAARAMLDQLTIRQWIPCCLYALGGIAEDAGDLPQAEQLMREAVTVAGTSPFPAAISASRLAAVRLRRGDTADAERWARLAISTGMPIGRLEADLVLADIARQRGDTGAAAQVRSALGAAASAGWLASPTYRRLAACETLSHSPPASIPSNRERRAFMFTDIVSSTALVELLGDDAWDHLLRWHDQTLRASFTEHRGEEINRIGDGFFVAFHDAASAAACAVDIQRGMDAHRRSNGFAPHLRIGLHQDEATRAGNDYQGLGVHVAARIAALAGAGEILASRQAVGELPDLAVHQRRTVSLRGLAEPVQVMLLHWT